MDAFWEKATVNPPVPWDKWITHWKLALPEKESIQLGILLMAHLQELSAHHNQLMAKNVENHTHSTERDCEVRNQQLKISWQN